MKNDVLLITSIFPPQVGGPAIFTSRFSNWLDTQQINSKVITYSIDEISDYENVKFVDLRKNRIKAFIKFISLIKKYSDKNTLILSNGAFVETFFACLFTKRKYVAKIPGDQVWELSVNRGWTTSSIENFQEEKLRIIQKILRLLFNLAFKNAKAIVAPSQQLANFLIAWGVEKQRIELVYNCVDPSKFKNLNITKKRYDLVTVCRLVPWKGLEELIACAIELNLRLAIIGDGPLMNDLKHLARNAPIDIEFKGNLNNEEVVNILNSSRIFVLNSKYEATSYALIEAKMCGLPIIANETDGSKTLIQESIDGYVVKASSTEDLKYFINKLMTTEKIRENFGVEARKDALKRFNQDINFPRIFNVMRD